VRKNETKVWMQIMKISLMGSGSTGGEKISANTDKTSKMDNGNIDFTKVLDKITHREYHEDLQRLIAEVDKMARKLTKSCTVSDLKKYKRAVKNFLKETIARAYQAHDEAGWDCSGRHKLYVLIKKVDQNLEDLSQQVLEKQAETLSILKKLDEIRGLLVDMYL